MSERREPEPARDPQDLAQFLIERARQGDAYGMAALYEPDAVLACGNGIFARGREAIRAFYAELLAKGAKFALGVQRPAIVSGALALTSTRLPDGSVTAEIARRQADGTWLWAIDEPAIA